jgi:hypothetical protein
VTDVGEEGLSLIVVEVKAIIALNNYVLNNGLAIV